MLLLEKLAASPTDSLTYYAFAEDNYPAGARRTETELRYIDIRPFKREYKLAESGGRNGGRQASLRALAELIARQRFNLNRANRLARHKPGDKIIAEDPLKIAGFEETLAGLTREFTEGVEGIVGQRIEPLHAAEEAMLGSHRRARPRPECASAGRHGGRPSPSDRGPRHAADPHRAGPRGGPRNARLRPHATAEDPQAQERRRQRRKRSPSNSKRWRRTRISSTRPWPASKWTNRMASPTRPRTARPPAKGMPKSRKNRPRKDDDAQKSDETPKGAKGQKGTGTGPGQGKGRRARRASRRTKATPASRRRTTAKRRWSGKRRSPIRPASWKRS